MFDYICVKYFTEMNRQLIEWTCEGVEMPPIDTVRLDHWIRDVAAAHDRTVGPIVYMFCDDERILEINRRHLAHDYYTDIITFDYTRGRRISGDIAISLDTVATNAAAVGADPMTELLRVIIHGVLHLCGINDKGPGEREIMERHEDEALRLIDR